MDHLPTCCKTVLMHQKRDAKRASTGIGPGLTEPARTPGVPFHEGMVLPILAFDSPCGRSQLPYMGEICSWKPMRWGNGLILPYTLARRSLNCIPPFDFQGSIRFSLDGFTHS